jgi:hypothetical protein
VHHHHDRAARSARSWARAHGQDAPGLRCVHPAAPPPPPPPLTRRDARLSVVARVGADPALAGHGGMTALMHAAAKGNLSLLQRLLELVPRHDAHAAAAMLDATAVAAGGSTAFHMACHNGNTDCVEELVRAGCNMKLRCAEHGRTGRDAAEQEGQQAVLARLRALVAARAARCALAAAAAASPEGVGGDADTRAALSGELTINRSARCPLRPPITAH